MSRPHELSEDISQQIHRASVLSVELSYSLAHRHVFSARSEAELLLSQLNKITDWLLNHYE